jgi:hypothetical protein
MVDVGPVYVRVGYRLVGMLMVVPSCEIRFFVRVPVVFVMFVRMGMGNGLMLVQVPVNFAVEQEHP